MISGVIAKLGLALIAVTSVAATLLLWLVLSYLGLLGPVEGNAVRPFELSGILFFGVAGMFAFLFWRLSRQTLASLVNKIDNWEHGE